MEKEKNVNTKEKTTEIDVYFPNEKRRLTFDAMLVQITQQIDI